MKKTHADSGLRKFQGEFQELEQHLAMPEVKTWIQKAEHIKTEGSAEGLGTRPLSSIYNPLSLSFPNLCM